LAAPADRLTEIPSVRENDGMLLIAMRRGPSRGTAGLCLLVVAAASACSSGPPPPDTRPYEQQVLEWRQSKDEAFRSTADDGLSPLPPAERASFQGLNYYAIDPAYRVPAMLERENVSPPVIVNLQTTGTQVDRYRKVGALKFTIGGQPQELAAFASEAGSLARLFVPFADATNGQDTYQGGRYLDLEQTATGLYDLDFNRAYNPFCVFNPSYICPLPPRENRLAIAIRAGEKLPASDKGLGG
jgi:hypothetical protein